MMMTIARAVEIATIAVSLLNGRTAISTMADEAIVEDATGVMDVGAGVVVTTSATTTTGGMKITTRAGEVTVADAMDADGTEIDATTSATTRTGGTKITGMIDDVSGEDATPAAIPIATGPTVGTMAAGGTECLKDTGCIMREESGVATGLALLIRQAGSPPRRGTAATIVTTAATKVDMTAAVTAMTYAPAPV